MIRGTVNNSREAIVRLTIMGSRQRKQTIEAVIDTGFDGFLTAAASLIAALALTWDSRGRVMLGDGSDSIFDSYWATVLWNRRRRRITVDEAETTPLVGMALLEGFELKIKVQPHGTVEITAIAQPRRQPPVGPVAEHVHFEELRDQVWSRLTTCTASPSVRSTTNSPATTSRGS
jgi:predicted aspartyl protease